ncbi:hypothetical protein [Rathayibacter sp. VKM Ac-2857]|uniref:hypothetical protein n=1 Tax=Rathayibacter sp. VKM Ac-2857 TaxID=2739020 RepID=UPI00156621C6|nr:hypothetical protein [Rathayibacter sp. VKM Ac-2857]NQX17245.1 hypothetical protein [Rathayibacter sp. VKM Ac-2857]
MAEERSKERRGAHRGLTARHGSRQARLPRAGRSRSGETAINVVAQVEAQALAYDTAASRGGEDGKTSNELRGLASDARGQAQLRKDAATDAPEARRSGRAISARADAGNSCDSSEPWETFAASLNKKGINVEHVMARLRADVD